MRTTSLLLLGLAFCLQAAAGEHHDHEGPIVGANGVKMKALFRIEKLKSNSDSVQLVLDLGANKYDSAKPAKLSARPQLLLTIGSLPVLTATADAKGKITGQFTGKLASKGAALKLDIKKSNLSALLSSMSNQPAEKHVHLSITLMDDTAAGGAAAILFADEFEMHIGENDKKLIAKAEALAEE